MLMILICLLQLFGPTAALVATELETPAAVLSGIVFLVLLYCLRTHQPRVVSLL
jgi:hypothetical protein